MDPIASPTVDITDPGVIALTWFLTWAIGKYAPWLSDKGRPIIPIVAVLIAVGVRAGLDASMGQPIDLESVTRGVAAGAAAVMGHSQVRGLQKALMKPPEEPVPAEAPNEDGEE